MNILILGVGNAQLDAIRFLKESGHKVFGLSYRHEGRGVGYVDEFDIINIIDKEKVAEFAQNNNIGLVYSVGSDIAMPTVGYVSNKLGLPYFVSEKTAELLQDKSAFRKFILDHKLEPIPYVSASDIDEVKDWDIFPSIIKPVDGQGQRGIYELNSFKDIEHYFSKAKENSRKGKVIIEKYLTGQEISVNSYVKDAETIYNFISTRDTVKNYPGGIVSGHKMPVHINEQMKSKIVNLVKNTITKLNIENGPVYFQMKYNDNDVHIIEVTPRLDGCHIWRLINEMYGVNLLKITFDHLINNNIEKIANLSENKKLELSFYLNKPGLPFKKDDYAIKYDAVYNEFYYSEGEKIRPINGHIDKVGYQIIKNN